jgi:hypothetical protein
MIYHAVLATIHSVQKHFCDRLDLDLDLDRVGKYDKQCRSYLGRNFKLKS